MFVATLPPKHKAVTAQVSRRHKVFPPDVVQRSTEKFNWRRHNLLFMIRIGGVAMNTITGAAPALLGSLSF